MHYSGTWWDSVLTLVLEDFGMEMQGTVLIPDKADGLDAAAIDLQNAINTAYEARQQKRALVE